MSTSPTLYVSTRYIDHKACKPCLIQSDGQSTAPTDGLLAETTREYTWACRLQAKPPEIREYWPTLRNYAALTASELLLRHLLARGVLEHRRRAAQPDLPPQTSHSHGRRFCTEAVEKRVGNSQKLGKGVESSAGIQPACSVRGKGCAEVPLSDV